MNVTLTVREDVLAALDRVIDPCSVGRQVPAGLNDMGMVESVVLTENAGGLTDVAIELQLTSPACHFQHWFDERVRSEVTAIEQIGSVTVSWSRKFDWSDDRMSDHLKQRLRDKRRTGRPAGVLDG